MFETMGGGRARAIKRFNFLKNLNNLHYLSFLDRLIV